MAPWRCACRSEEVVSIESENGIHSKQAQKKSTRTAIYKVPIHSIPVWYCSQPTEIQNTVTSRTLYCSQPTRYTERRYLHGAARHGRYRYKKRAGNISAKKKAGRQTETVYSQQATKLALHHSLQVPALKQPSCYLLGVVPSTARTRIFLLMRYSQLPMFHSLPPPSPSAPPPSGPSQEVYVHRCRLPAALHRRRLPPPPLEEGTPSLPPSLQPRRGWCGECRPRMPLLPQVAGCIPSTYRCTYIITLADPVYSGTSSTSNTACDCIYSAARIRSYRTGGRVPTKSAVVARIGHFIQYRTYRSYRTRGCVKYPKPRTE